MATTEKHTVSGDQVLGKVKELIRKGNVRKVRLIHEDKTLLEIPLKVGVPVAAVGILALPLLAAIGAVAALVTECTIEIEKVEESEASKD